MLLLEYKVLVILLWQGQDRAEGSHERHERQTLLQLCARSGNCTRKIPEPLQQCPPCLSLALSTEPWKRRLDDAAQAEEGEYGGCNAREKEERFEEVDPADSGSVGEFIPAVGLGFLVRLLRFLCVGQEGRESGGKERVQGGGEVGTLPVAVVCTTRRGLALARVRERRAAKR